MNIVLTQKAKEQIDYMLENKSENLNIRISVKGFGWGGPVLGMALEESYENDTKINQQNIDFYFEESIKGYAAIIIIEYIDNDYRKGFKVSYKENKDDLSDSGC